MAFNWDWKRLDPSVGPLFPSTEVFGLANPNTLTDLNSTLPLLLKREVSEAFAITPDYADDGTIDSETYVWIKQTDELWQDSAGRSKLPETAFSRKALEVEIPDNIYQ